jgi:hypothetical protein
MEKSSLDIIIESLTDYDWAQLELRVDAKKELQKAALQNAKTTSAIKFGYWILKNNISIVLDKNKDKCWCLEIHQNSETNEKETIYLTTHELYNMYHADSLNLVI